MDNCKATPLEELKVKKEKINFKFRWQFKDLEYPEWITFYNKWDYFKFTYSPWTYFDPRPEIRSNVTSVIVLAVLLVSLVTLDFSWYHLLLLPFLFFGWGDFYLHLPFDSGKDTAEYPDYGFYVYHVDPIPGKFNMPQELVLRWGKLYKTVNFPWNLTWVRTSILLKAPNENLPPLVWEHETKGNYKEFYTNEWKDKQYMVEYNYLDKYDNTIVPTKVYVEEREWRPIWFTWTSLFSNVRRTIDVHFSKEVGARKGSWKGGVVGCGYPMKKGETALECIKRMEQERKF